jgi:hypothetical protein
LSYGAKTKAAGDREDFFGIGDFTESWYAEGENNPTVIFGLY